MTTQLESYIAEHEGRFLEDLKGWLRIPSISTLPEHAGDIRRDNLYCRGACDDKGQTMLVFKALESLMAVDGKLPVNVCVLIEGEEEAGGESIEAYVRAYPERLKCEAAFICDSHMPSKELP